jgi:hypothetical protein
MDGWEGIMPSCKPQRVDPVPTADYILAAAQRHTLLGGPAYQREYIPTSSSWPELDIITEHAEPLGGMVVLSP